MSKYTIAIIVISILILCVKCSENDYNSYNCDYARLGGMQYLEECME